MDKSGSNNNPKKSVCLAQSSSSKIRLAPSKTVDWAIGTLEGCKRKRCCGVALDADVYFHTAHEYFKAFTKCREAKAHSDAKLKLHEQRKIELVEKVCMLQAAFSDIAQEKEALRAESVLSGSENVKLRSKLHEQKALSVRLEAKVQELADDMRDLQKQVGELQLRCDGLEEEVEVKHGEINKLRTSMEQKQCKQLAAVVEQKNQQCNADARKSETRTGKSRSSALRNAPSRRRRRL
uniref:Myosin-6-like n=1 Tax=Globodera pallida TaxID=36090 RepID=A0A183CDQ8_GLOPA